MKIIIPLVVIVALIIYSCRICGCDVPQPPRPLIFEVIGKNGKSLVTSLKDSVAISYVDPSSRDKTIRLLVRKLYANFQDTTTLSPKYNGLYIIDNGQISIASSQISANQTFTLSINGGNAGVISVNYRQYLASYPQLSSLALTFNDMPANYDPTIAIPGSGLNLLQE